MPISDIFQSNNQNQPICSNIGSNSTSTPATTTTTTTTSTAAAAAAANTSNNDDGLQLSSDHRQPSRSSNDSSASYGPHSYQSNVQPSTLSLPQASIDIFSISNWFPALDRSLADSSQPNRLSSAPDPEKGLNVVQYRELDKVKIPIDYPVSNKPPPPQPSLAPLPATTRVKTTVPVQATAAGDGEKLPHSSIAFDDLNRFWTSSSNTDQASFNNRSLHSFTDPRRPEPIQPRQQQDLSKRPPQLFTSVPDRSPIMVCEPTLLAGMTHEMVSLNQLNYPLSESDLINRSSSNPIYQDGMVLSISGGDGNNNLKCFDHQSNSFSSKQSYTTPSPYINKFPRERSSIDTFRTIQPSIRNPSINNEFLTTNDRSRLSDNKNQTVFVETQATNEEMSLFEQQVLNHQRSNKMKTNLHQSSQMKQFLIEGRISEKELDDLCNMFDKKATCQERKNLWGQLVAIKPEWDVIGQEFKECYKKTCELTKNATIGIK
ncbi:hypothetical protein BY996DRAFT_6704507 [Phakopsora pachyrhizi]|nr:hypothetical protein BY996DRAFT_6704507 [Phakopsora pachyrhizi]